MSTPRLGTIPVHALRRQAHCVDAAGDHTLFMRNLPEIYPSPQAPACVGGLRDDENPRTRERRRECFGRILSPKGLSGHRQFLPWASSAATTGCPRRKGASDDKGHFIDPCAHAMRASAAWSKHRHQRGCWRPAPVGTHGQQVVVLPSPTRWQQGTGLTLVRLRQQRGRIGTKSQAPR